MSSLKSLEQFSQDSHGAFCQKGIDNLFKWFHTIEQDGKTKKALRLNLGVQQQGLKVYQFVQMMVVGWPLTFLQQGQICALIHLYVENVKKSFSQNVLKTISWNLQ